MGILVQIIKCKCEKKVMVIAEEKKEDGDLINHNNCNLKVKK